MCRRVTSDSLVQSEPSKLTMVLCSSTECLYAGRQEVHSTGQVKKWDKSFFSSEDGHFCTIKGQSVNILFSSMRSILKESSEVSLLAVLETTMLVIYIRTQLRAILCSIAAEGGDGALEKNGTTPFSQQALSFCCVPPFILKWKKKGGFLSKG
ncbi:hypothetical protein AVEN_74509-1 [Araneus ventricosus]|uniref:Uncharacterized protein n=1 Tax=Araneus ventricosus TaxID=182803 RepID=A0A4Y2T1C6_ARAVE|nr:hypothetical protein AVEN_196231-1 [Araneus ventricosus]GBN94021.1 hypothetical protein AVEN_74509-1 [Araneus ventricosus]